MLVGLGGTGSIGLGGQSAVEGEHSVSTARWPVARAVALVQQPAVPAHLGALCRRLQVLVVAENLLAEHTKIDICSSVDIYFTVQYAQYIHAYCVTSD